MAKRKIFEELTRGRRRDEEASRREADAAELQGRSDAASVSGFQVYPRDSEEDAVFAGGICAKTTD